MFSLKRHFLVFFAAILVASVCPQDARAQTSPADLPPGCSEVAPKLQGNLFFDDFNDYTEGDTGRPNWTHFLGHPPSIMSGKLILQASPTPFAIGASLCLPRVKNIILSADFKLFDTQFQTDPKFMEFRFRIGTEPQFTPSRDYSSVVRFSGDTLSIRAFAGPHNNRKSDIVGIPYDVLQFDVNYRIRIEALEGDLSVFIDDVLILEHTLTDPDFIKSGFFTFSSVNLKLDNVSIQILD
jgi:hypothetical protein